MVALIPNDQSSSDPELLIVLGIKDKLKAKQFFDKLTEKIAQKPKETQYKGVSLWQMTTDQGATFNYALLDDRLVGASQQQALEQAIDSYKGQPSLADNSQHKALFTNPLTLKNPVAQFYLVD